MNRVSDIILAIFGLAISAPLIGIAALALYLTSGGPIIFRQIRVGMHGRRFLIRKLRTMTSPSWNKPIDFNPGEVKRITPFGRILRRLKIDELPQLWNVLMGEMSFVGPRPEVLEWVASNPAQWERVLLVKPGITDPASIAFYDEEAMLSRSPDPQKMYKEVILPRKLAIYNEYVDTRTVLGDMNIILKTVLSIIAHVHRRPHFSAVSQQETR